MITCFSLCCFKSTFYAKSLIFLLVKRYFRSYCHPPNVTPRWRFGLFTGLSVPSTRTNWMEGDGRSTPFSAAQRGSQTCSRSSCYLRPIGRRERRTLVPTYVVVQPAWACGFILTVYSHILDWCRHCCSPPSSLSPEIIVWLFQTSMQSKSLPSPFPSSHRY